MGRRQSGHQGVDDGDGDLAGAEQQEKPDQPEEPATLSLGPRLRDENSRQQERDDNHAAEVQAERVAEAHAPYGLDKGEACAHRVSEAQQPLVHEVEADMSRPAVRTRVGRGLASQTDRARGDLPLFQPEPPRRRLHDMAIAVPRGKVHQGVHAGRVVSKDLFDTASGLDKRPPVSGPEEPQAADAVADRHLVGGLLLVLRLHQVLDRQIVLGQSLFDPRQRQGQRRALALQAAGELGNEGPDHRRLRPRHVGDRQDETLRVFLGDLRHLVGPVVGTVPIRAVGPDPGGNASQILEQRQPQHDRDGPQLTGRERRHLLIGRDEAAEAVRVQAAVAVRDRFEGDVVDPRQTGRRAVSEAWQFAFVARRKVPPGRADLLLDQVEVVEQPLARRRDSAVAVHGFGEQRPDGQQHRLVLRQPRQQPVRSMLRAQPVRGGQHSSVLHHLLAAEQLRAKRWLFAGEARREVRPAGDRMAQRAQPNEDGFLAELHSSGDPP